MHFLNGARRDPRLFFMPDSPRGHGGGGEDPHDHDDYLAAIFKQALSRAHNSSTANPPHLLESVEEILERVEQAGKLLILLSRDLQPIAKRIMDIPGYSDKRNPIILAHSFEDFDLRVDL